MSRSVQRPDFVFELAMESSSSLQEPLDVAIVVYKPGPVLYCPVFVSIMFACSPTGVAHASLHNPTCADANHVKRVI